MQSLKPSLATLNTARQSITVSPDSWRDGKTSAERGYGYKWQKAREAYLLANPLCVMCYHDGRVTAATVVDHIKAHRGDMRLFWDRGNWQGLCQHHHSSHAQRRDHADRG